MSEPTPFLIETAGVTLRIVPERLDPKLMTAADGALLRLLVGLIDDTGRWAAYPPVGLSALDLPGDYECADCGRRFATGKQLGGHASSHRMLRCPNPGCGRTLRPSAYSNHVLSCPHGPEQEAAYRCGSDGCDAAFPTATARAGHRTSAHPGEFPGRKPKVRVKKSGPGPVPAVIAEPERKLTVAPPALSAEQVAEQAARSATQQRLLVALDAVGVRPGRVGSGSWTVLEAVAGAGSDEQAAAYASAVAPTVERRLRRELDLDVDDSTVEVLAAFRQAARRGSSAVA